MLSLDIGASGMQAQQTNVDVISNNIANMSTNGFKRQRVEFHDLIYQNKERPGAPAASDGTNVPAGLQLGLGVRTASTYRLHEQGALENTGNNLDMAVSGEGYFQVEQPNGEIAYTRNGTFQVNEDGELVTTQGNTVEPGINIPENATGININEQGQVSVTLPNQVDEQVVGRIELAQFVNPAGLEAVGNTMFKETEASGAPIVGNPGEEEFGSIRQGFVESSNVSVVDEMTNMISAQRAYEMNSRVISTTDQMMQTAGQLR